MQHVTAFSRAQTVPAGPATARLEPRRAAVQNDLGRVVFQEGQLSQAIMHFEEALRLDPEWRPARWNLRVARMNEMWFRSRTP